MKKLLLLIMMLMGCGDGDLDSHVGVWKLLRANCMGEGPKGNSSFYLNITSHLIQYTLGETTGVLLKQDIDGKCSTELRGFPVEPGTMWPDAWVTRKCKPNPCKSNLVISKSRFQTDFGPLECSSTERSLVPVSGAFIFHAHNTRMLHAWSFIDQGYVQKCTDWYARQQDEDSP